MPAVEGFVAFAVLVAVIAGGVFIYAVVGTLFATFDIAGFAINAGLLAVGLCAIEKWPESSGAWFFAFCAFAIGGFICSQEFGAAGRPSGFHSSWILVWYTA
jgi:hypothetical protein